MEDCLFCKFVGGELKTNIVYEDEDFIIIRDIDPKAKNHFLAIPRKHFKEEFLPEEREGEYFVGYTGNYVRCYVKNAEIGKMISVKITERYLDGAKAVPVAEE